MRRSVVFERPRASTGFVIILALSACGSTPSAGETTSDGPASSSSSADPTASTTSTTSTTSAGTSETSAGEGIDSSGDESSTGGDFELAGNCDLANHVGGFFAVNEQAEEQSYSAFSGSVADGVVPLNVLEQVGEEGDCVLWRRNNPFCDPGCAAGESCDFDGNCIPYPINHDIGTVTATGLAKPVMLEPVPPTYSYFDTMLGYPGFEPGSVITVRATGGDYSPLLLHGIGVGEVDPALDEVHLASDTPLDVEWTPGDPRTTMRLQLGVDQHGTSPIAMICSAPADVGSLTIAGELITDFLENGISGFPSADFYFETVDSVTIEPGCVDFVVRSHDQVIVFVEGHTPCNVPGDCPKGQTCDVMNQTCV